MANYTKATNFAAKDSLPSGNSGKIIKGTEIDTEFNAIASAVASKPDSNSPVFTGTPTAPTAVAGTDTTQLATTAFVNTAVTNERTATATLTNKTLTSPTINGGTIAGITDLAIADGGTGASSFTANTVLLGNGSSSFQTVAPSTSGHLLTSNGTTWISQAPQYTGTVTSITAGTGLSGGTITTSGTISLAAPTSNSIGSYALVAGLGNNIPTTTFTYGSDYGTGAGAGQFGIAHIKDTGTLTTGRSYGTITGTWRWLSATITGLSGGEYVYGIAVRIA